MTKRDPERTERLRTAIKYMLEKGTLATGSQSRLAEHFDVSRQRVHQIVVEERRYIERRQTTIADPAQQSVRAS
jgi:hypothetical protein